MEILNLIMILLGCVFGCACFVLVGQFSYETIQRSKISKHAMELAIGQNDLKDGVAEESIFVSGWIAWLLRNGVKYLKKPCEYLLSHIAVLDKLMEDFVYLLECKKVSSDKVSAFSALCAMSIVAGLIVGLLFASAIAAIAVVLLLTVIFVTTLKSSIDKRNDELRDSVPDALRSMGSCFQSGYTLLQTFDFLAEESDGEIKVLFETCSNILKTGGTIPEALEQLKGNKSAPELAFVAVALDVQHQSGGSIGPVIDAARDMVESRLDLLQKLKVQTAQAKLSARVVTILPFALIACFSIISPNFLAPFFSSLLGIVVLSIAAIMQIAGVICVRRMLDVKV